MDGTGTERIETVVIGLDLRPFGGRSATDG